MKSKEKYFIKAKMNIQIPREYGNNLERQKLIQEVISVNINSFKDILGVLKHNFEYTENGINYTPENADFNLEIINICKL